MKYQELTIRLKKYILDNQIAHGSRLPPTDELAEILRTDPATMEAACAFCAGMGELIARENGYAVNQRRSEQSFKTILFTAGVKAAEGLVQGIEELGGTCEIVKNVNKILAVRELLATKENLPDACLFWTFTGSENYIDEIYQMGVPVLEVRSGTKIPRPWDRFSFLVDEALVRSVSRVYREGHHDFALVAPRKNERFDFFQIYKQACLMHGLRESSERRLSITKDNANDLGALFRKFVKKHSSFSALICSRRIAAPLRKAIEAEGYRVPEDYSMVVFEDDCSDGSDFTAYAFDYQEVGRFMAFWIHRRIQEHRKQLYHIGRLPRFEINAVYQPGKTLLNKTAEPQNSRVVEEKPYQIVDWEDISIRNDNDALLEIAQEMRMRPHRYIENYPEKLKFEKINLRPFNNRAFLHGEDSWLGGLFLEHLPYGESHVHGVPFEILKDEENQNKTCVVFNSTGDHDYSLPESITIPIQRRVKAVYFLHGCGYAENPVRFAKYEMKNEANECFELFLVAMSKKTQNVEENLLLHPNIQDWWPPYPHVENEEARCWPLVNPANILEPPHFLYTLEWVNPSPASPLESIEVKANPLIETNLGLVAVTIVI